MPATKAQLLAHVSSAIHRAQDMHGKRIWKQFATQCPTVADRLAMLEELYHNPAERSLRIPENCIPSLRGLSARNTGVGTSELSRAIQLLQEVRLDAWELWGRFLLGHLDRQMKKELQALRNTSAHYKPRN